MFIIKKMKRSTAFTQNLQKAKIFLTVYAVYILIIAASSSKWSYTHMK